jgi:hypothetical protein
VRQRQVTPAEQGEPKPPGPLMWPSADCPDKPEYEHAASEHQHQPGPSLGRIVQGGEADGRDQHHAHQPGNRDPHAPHDDGPFLPDDTHEAHPDTITQLVDGIKTNAAFQRNYIKFYTVSAEPGINAHTIDAFRCAISSVTPSEFEACYRGLPMSRRSPPVPDKRTVGSGAPK